MLNYYDCDELILHEFTFFTPTLLDTKRAGPIPNVSHAWRPPLVRSTPPSPSTTCIQCDGDRSRLHQLAWAAGSLCEPEISSSMSSRAGFRPRPVDVSKPLPIVRDVAELDVPDLPSVDPSGEICADQPAPIRTDPFVSDRSMRRKFDFSATAV